MPDNESCEGCKFWDRLDEGEDQGVCRRHAPVAIQLSTIVPYPDPVSKIKPDPWPAFENRAAIFPGTVSWDWCGEFKAAD